MTGTAPEEDDARTRAMAAEYAAARELLEHVRQAQLDSDKSMRGRRNIDVSASMAITDVRQHSGLITSIAETYDIPSNTLYGLMESFEEMARRHKVSVPNHLRPAIYKILAVELMGNIQHFSPKEKAYGNFIGVTYLQGNISDIAIKHIGADPSKPTYGEFFKGSESVLRIAAVSYPADPEGFLDKVVAKIEVLPDKHIGDDPSKPTYGEFFAGNESVLKIAAVSYPADPEGFLDRAVAKIEVLPGKYIGGDPSKPTYGEFFKGNESVLKIAAIHHLTDPEGFLDKVVAKIEALPGKHIGDDPLKPTYGEFFAGNESILKHAAVNHPTDPEGFLDRAVAKIEALPGKYIGGDPSKPTYGEFFKGNESVLKIAAIHHLTDPEGFLDRAVESMPALERAHPNSTRSERILAAAHAPGKPAEYLKTLMAKRDGGRQAG